MKRRHLTLLTTAMLVLAVRMTNATTVVTTPMGIQQKTITIGQTDLGIPLTNADTLSASVTANTTVAVTLQGVSNAGNLLTAGEPYYVEVVEGSLEGERFEVNTAATINSANNTVTIDPASPNNTLALTAGALVDNRIALRKHITVEQAQSFFSPALVGNNSAASADQLSVFNSQTGTFTAYFLRSDGVTWRQVGTTTVVNKTAIPPGSGILVTKRGSTTTFTSNGSVRMSDFAMPMRVGQNFLSPAYPSAYSPATLGGLASEGWTGNNSAGNADQIRTFNANTGVFTSYYLRGDGVSWRQVGTANTVTSVDLISDNCGFMVDRKTADNNYILIAPFSDN